MKISRALRNTFETAKERYSRLSTELKEHLQSTIESNGWFYTSRVKEIESFALKVETGRVPDPTRMEDFFACTLIVPTLAHIDEAERFICGNYDLVERRPLDDTKTRKQASDFRFDDLRLYVARRASSSGKWADLDGAVFEVQIKTILQHAWAIATHDLIYKADTVSWPKERIAFQVKAMLEHAEIAIAEAERLADAPGVSKKDQQTDETLKVLDCIRRFWPEPSLPHNRKRLAETIVGLLTICRLEATQLKDILDAEKTRVGLLPRDLSPYSFTLQALLHTSVINFKERFTHPSVRKSIVIQDGMDVPDWVASHDRVIDLRSGARPTPLPVEC